MNRSQKRFLLILVLLLAALMLSGCGGIDPETGEYNGGFFEVLAGPLRTALIFIHDSLLAPLGVTYAWGWSIILMALFIRLLLLPLGLRQMRSMKEAQAKMKLIQPELDKIKKRHAKDKKKLQEEQMKLYQQHGITQAQMAGCLPTLIQMPILFAFYYAILGLAAGGYINGEPFYFIPDISFPEYRTGMSWLTTDFPQSMITYWPYLVLPALLAITQFVMVKTGQMGQAPTTGDDSNPAAGMMGQMTWLMTGMFVFFALQVPAGLSLYWVVGNLLALAQQFYVNRQKDQWEQDVALKPALATAGASASDSGESASVEPSPSKKSSKSSKSSTQNGTTRRKRRKRR